MPHPAAQLLLHLPELLRKGKVGHRFEHIVQRTHRVPADGVLGHIRDEDDDDVLVQLPHPPGRLHPVQMLHLHVQKQDIVHRAVIIQQLHPVGKLRHSKLGAILPGVPLHIALQLRPHLCLVLHKSDAYHCRTSFFRNFSGFYCNTKPGRWQMGRPFFCRVPQSDS